MHYTVAEWKYLGLAGEVLAGQKNAKYIFLIFLKNCVKVIVKVNHSQQIYNYL